MPDRNLEAILANCVQRLDQLRRMIETEEEKLARWRAECVETQHDIDQIQKDMRGVRCGGG